MPSLNKRLREACCSGNYEEFSNLFEIVNIDVTSQEGWELAHFVVSIPEPESECEGECKYSSRIRILRVLIDRGIDANKQDGTGRTPLHVAAENGFVCAIKLLITENGVSVDVLTPSRVTPLMLACRHERYSAIKVLLEYRANVDLTYLPDIGCSAIHYIAYSGNVPTMRLLLKHGGLVNATLPNFNHTVPLENYDIDSSDEDEKMNITPLHLASQKKNVEMVRCLLEAGATATLQHHNGMYDLHYMASVGDPEIIRLLVDQGALVNAKSPDHTTPLFYACQYGNYNNVVLLLELGADPSLIGKSNASPLAYAILGGNVEIVKLFVKLGYKLEKYEDGKIMPGKCSPVTIAAFYGYKELFMFSQEQGFPIDYRESDGSMPIHFAAMQGCFEMCEYILSLGMNINCKNNELKTPLHLAARMGQSSMCKYLIEKGADTKVVDIKGRTVLHAAVESWKCDTVGMILNFDPHIINIPDKYGESPLILSNCFLRVNNVKMPSNLSSMDVLLLRYGANPNNRRRNGSLLVQDYALFQYESCTLLNYGADITFTSNQRKSALDKAIVELAKKRHIIPDDDSEEDFIAIDQVSSGSDDHFLLKGEDHNYTFCGAELIVSHANKLRAANMGCTDRTVESLQLPHKNYYKKCLKEIAAMKKLTIAEYLSLYSFLVAPVEGCLRTPGTEEVLMQLNPFKDFPIYSSMLTDKLERAQDYKRLLEAGTKFFNLLSDNKAILTYDCIRTILSLLDIQSLISLERVVHPNRISFIDIPDY